jgi:hypothetical protein
MVLTREKFKKHELFALKVQAWSSAHGQSNAGRPYKRLNVSGICSVNRNTQSNET